MKNVNTAICAVGCLKKGKWYYKSVWHDIYERKSDVIDSQETSNKQFYSIALFAY